MARDNLVGHVAPQHEPLVHWNSNQGLFPWWVLDSLVLPEALLPRWHLTPWRQRSGRRRELGDPVEQHSLARVARISDPVERYKAARVAGQAVAEQYADIEVDALRELTAAHRGNEAAAARELGISPQAVHKRLAKRQDRPADPPTTAAAQQTEPALHFDSPSHAEDSLRDWALRRQDVDDQRDVFLLGALAVGVDPVTVSDLTDQPLDLLRRIRPAGNIAISQLDQFGPELEKFTRDTTAHAAELTARAQTPAEDSGARIWSLTAASIVSNAAPYALDAAPTVKVEDYTDAEEFAEAFLTEAKSRSNDQEYVQQDEVAIVNGADAWLATLCVQLTRQADESRTQPLGDPESSAAMAQAFEDIAGAVRHLRSTGTAPALGERKDG